MHGATQSQFSTQFLEVMKYGGVPTAPGRHGDTVLHKIIRAGVRNADERIAVAVAEGAGINAIDHLKATPIETTVGRCGQYDLALFKTLLVSSICIPASTWRSAAGNAVLGRFFCSLKHGWTKSSALHQSNLEKQSAVSASRGLTQSRALSGHGRDNGPILLTQSLIEVGDQVG